MNILFVVPSCSLNNFLQYCLHCFIVLIMVVLILCKSIIAVLYTTSYTLSINMIQNSTLKYDYICKICFTKSKKDIQINKSVRCSLQTPFPMTSSMWFHSGFPFAWLIPTGCFPTGKFPEQQPVLRRGCSVFRNYCHKQEAFHAFYSQLLEEGKDMGPRARATL